MHLHDLYISQNLQGDISLADGMVPVVAWIVMPDQPSDTMVRGCSRPAHRHASLATHLRLALVPAREMGGRAEKEELTCNSKKIS